VLADLHLDRALSRGSEKQHDAERGGAENEDQGGGGRGSGLQEAKGH
jgi:hypothetical protein